MHKKMTQKKMGLRARKKKKQDSSQFVRGEELQQLRIDRITEVFSERGTTIVEPIPDTPALINFLEVIRKETGYFYLVIPAILHGPGPIAENVSILLKAGFASRDLRPLLRKLGYKPSTINRLLSSTSA